MARDETGSVAAFYSGERGEKLASFLRGLISSEAELDFEAMEWPAILDALMAGETVKPHPGGHPRLFHMGCTGSAPANGGCHRDRRLERGKLAHQDPQ